MELIQPGLKCNQIICHAYASYTDILNELILAIHSKKLGVTVISITKHMA